MEGLLKANCNSQLLTLRDSYLLHLFWDICEDKLIFVCQNILKFKFRPDKL